MPELHSAHKADSSQREKTHRSYPALHRILRGPSGESPKFDSDGNVRNNGAVITRSHHWYTELVGERVYVRVQCGMKVPDREITRVGNRMCAEGSRKRGDEKRGRRQRKYRYSTLADLDAHGGGGRGTVHPAVTCFSRRTRSESPFSIVAISDTPLAASLAAPDHPTRLLLPPSPTPQTQVPLNHALHLTADCSPCLQLEIDVVSMVGSLLGRVASARSVE